MGNYVTADDVQGRFESVASLARITGSEDDATVDAAVVTEAIAAGEGLADSYFASANFDTPLVVSGDANLAATVKGMVLDVIVMRLFCRPDQGVAPESVVMAYENAVTWLQGVAAGKIKLNAATTLAQSDSNEPVSSWGIAGAAVAGTSQRMFSRETMERL